MTDLTPEVMKDLMVVYLSGEASSDTRRLVEAYAGEHREFAELLRKSSAIETGPAAAPPKTAELKSLQMTRQHIFLRSLFFGMGIAFTLMPLSIVFKNNQIVFLLYRDAPGLGIAFWSLAAASWTACFVMHRAVRKAGL